MTRDSSWMRLAALGLLVLGAAVADSRERSIRARLVGFQEVPAVSTEARGEFRGRINRAETEISYELEFSGLEGSVTQSHVHLGQTAVNGGIMFFLCGTSGFPGPAGTPVCPASGRVTGTITAAQVIGPAGQGIDPGVFAEVLRALRGGVSYANVHSTKWPGGELRGQIQDDD